MVDDFQSYFNRPLLHQSPSASQSQVTPCIGFFHQMVTVPPNGLQEHVSPLFDATETRIFCSWCFSAIRK